MLLGCDFLRTNKAIIEFEKETVSFGINDNKIINTFFNKQNNNKIGKLKLFYLDKEFGKENYDEAM